MKIVIFGPGLLERESQEERQIVTERKREPKREIFEKFSLQRK